MLTPSAHNRAVIRRHASLFLDEDYITETTRPEPGAKRIDLLTMLSKANRLAPALAKPLEVA